MEQLGFGRGGSVYHVRIGESVLPIVGALLHVIKARGAPPWIAHTAVEITNLRRKKEVEIRTLVKINVLPNYLTYMRK